jgi:hypothetical protein
VGGWAGVNRKTLKLISSGPGNLPVSPPDAISTPIPLWWIRGESEDGRIVEPTAIVRKLFEEIGRVEYELTFDEKTKLKTAAHAVPWQEFEEAAKSSGASVTFIVPAKGTGN